MEVAFHRENYYALAICIVDDREISINKALLKMGIKHKTEEADKTEINLLVLNCLYNFKRLEQREIAKMYDTKQARVNYLILKSELRSNKEKRLRSMLDVDTVVRMRREGKTQKEIGNSFGLSQAAVYKFIKTHNVNPIMKGEV